MELLSSALQIFLFWNIIVTADETTNVDNDHLSKISRVDLKIIGGFTSESHRYPFIVGISTKQTNGRSGWCGGALVSMEFVVTAAHCIMRVKEVTLHLGSHKIEIEGIKIRVLQNNFITHSDWHPRYAAHDIALIHLPERIVESDTIHPIELPSAQPEYHIQTGITLTAAGWGRTSRNFTILRPKTLEVIRLNVISNDICSKMFPYYNSTFNICLDGNPKRTICRGDSGGPVFLTDPKLGTHTLIGITSYGKKCDSATVLTRIASYLDWIKPRLNITP